MRLVLIMLLCLAGPLHAAPATRPAHQPGGPGLVWRDWSADAFEQAKREHRLVILHLGAVWCHWCHVMEETTYRDPAVIKILQDHFVLIYVDQDARPDLSNRYEDYGWPATIIFDANGRELVKMAGYIPPKRMISLLNAVVADPTPGPSVVREKAVRGAGVEVAEVGGITLDLALWGEMTGRFFRLYDSDAGAWGTTQKFLYADGVELAMRLPPFFYAAAHGSFRERDKGAPIDPVKCRQMAEQTLKANLALIDPVWGGVYQYSTDDDWKHPHFEKIMSYQADDLRIYALAYNQWHHTAYLKAAIDLHRYLHDFLMSPDGAFYVSQDADVVPGEHWGEYFKLDDAGRRARGMPRIDNHLYARENGWAIRALASLYAATGDKAALNEAVRAAEWVIAHRAISGSPGGFHHDEKDAAGPYLGDTLAMGNAFLSLYEVTGDRKWLAQLRESALFIAAHFSGGGTGGFVTSIDSSGGAAAPLKPIVELDENVTLARWCNRLYRYTGDKAFQQMAERAMRYLTAPQVARSRGVNAGVLLADMEGLREPMHITVVGAKDDPKAAELFREAQKYPSSYKRVEWWDKREGPMPNPDVEYPSLPGAAAFLCSNGVCRSPISAPEKIVPTALRLNQ